VTLTDLKIIDELLVLMKPLGRSWDEFERSYSIVNAAMERLRIAYLSGEMQEITLSLANYFRERRRQ